MSFFGDFSLFFWGRARDGESCNCPYKIFGISHFGGSLALYPLTRKHYENNSLRIIFLYFFVGICDLKISGKERLLPEITSEIRNFQK